MDSFQVFLIVAAVLCALHAVCRAVLLVAVAALCTQLVVYSLVRRTDLTRPVAAIKQLVAGRVLTCTHTW